MFKTYKNHNSVKIVLDFAGVLRLLGNNSVIPLLTAAKKRHFYPPKLPALRAEVDVLAQKSARLFSCFLAATSKIPRFCPLRCFPRLPHFLFRPNPLRWASVEFLCRTLARCPVLGFRWARARLCPENRTQPRHAVHAGGRAVSCCASWSASNRFRMRSCSHSASSFASFCS